MKSLKPITILSIVILLLLTSCQSNTSGGEPAPPSESAQESEESDKIRFIFPESLAEPPQGPLTGILRVPNVQFAPSAGISRIPIVQIIPSRQTQEELAQSLNTTTAMLRFVNPRLPDPVPSGTLIIHPTVYHLEELGSVGDVSEATGHSIRMLLAANPSIDPDTELAEGTLLAVPQLYIVPEDIPLSAAAKTLGTDDETLLSANPSLLADEDDNISAGKVLVVPPSMGQEE